MKKRVIILILAVVLAAAGCANDAAKPPENSSPPEHSCSIHDRLDDYMASVKEQSDVISTSLEQDALTQADMNLKAQELYNVWDDALNHLWGELKTTLPEAEFAKLQDEQRTWIAEKEKIVNDAGKEFQGGSVYPLIVNSEAAKLTQARVYRLYELLQQIS